MPSLLRVAPSEGDDAWREALTGFVDARWGARLEDAVPLAPGLGTRRFFRLKLSGGAPPAVSMIARVDAEEDPAKRADGVAPEPPLEPIRHFLADHGVPVPERHADLPALHTELLEDLGDTSLERVASDPSTERARRTDLYREACKIIVRLQEIEGPAAGIDAFDRRLDRRLFQSKADRVVGWALPYWLGREVTQSDERVVREVYDRVATIADRAPQRLSHRDFKAANVHLTEDDRLVLIDLQGAFLAPPEYDLVCLLRDPHVELPRDDVDALLAACRESLPDAPSAGHFEQRFTLLTLTRVAKDAAHYIHAHTHAGDDRYLPWLPTARRYLIDAADRASSLDPAFAAFATLTREWREP